MNKAYFLLISPRLYWNQLLRTPWLSITIRKICSASYPRILCCTCSGTSRPPSPGKHRHSCRDLAGRGCCRIHPPRCRTDFHPRSPAGWGSGCWHLTCGCSPPDRLPTLSSPLHWRPTGGKKSYTTKANWITLNLQWRNAILYEVLLIHFIIFP